MNRSVSRFACLLQMFLLLTLAANAQDIIVLNSGDLIKAHVKEIGLAEIRYQRADQADGPVYSLLKADIFAIHYADGTKDVFTRSEQNVATANKQLENFLLDTLPLHQNEDVFLKRTLTVRFGTGLHKIYSPVNEIGVNNYKNQTPFWQIDIGVGITTNTVCGVAYSNGKYTATETFSDLFQLSETTFDIQQNISSFSLWGRYYARTRYDNFRPYATVGLILNSSNVSTSIVTSTDSETITFNRGGTLMDVAPLVKLGAEFDAFDYLSLYAEAGYGITLINVGLGYRFARR